MNETLLPWPEDQPTVSLFPEAARCFGMGRSAAYSTYHDGTFPVPVIRCGYKLRVSTHELRGVLGLPTSKKVA